MVDAIAGEPDFHYLVSPYSVATDSRGRILVTDTGATGLHIFDFGQQKYKFVSRRDTGKDPMLNPQCVAVDAQDNIYVTDSGVGKIFVFDPSGKFLLAENQNTNTIVEFRIDPVNGKLTPTGETLSVPSPVCIAFLPVD